ncbi:hypothetical protein DVH05_004105 [Phytophthora capsici]|nr:hypothetical protein DVH05_004105 [Phytophthora capsici]
MRWGRGMSGHRTVERPQLNSGDGAVVWVASGDDEERVNQLTPRHHTTVVVGEVCHRDELSVEVTTANMVVDQLQ